MERKEDKAEAEKHKRFICSIRGCAAAYNKQWKLDAHFCKHSGVKPHTCEHEGCGKSFTSPYHLTRHSLTHSGERPFPCTEDGCAEAFTTNANRQRHIGRRHGPRAYVCGYERCGREFKKKQLLRAHMCELHADAPPYRCPHGDCGMSFSAAGKLKRHEKVHRGYPCAEEGCGFSGKTWTEYLSHRRERHRPEFSCGACSKTFRDRWNLRQHQAVHGATRTVLKCPRENCERTYTSGFNLLSHIRSFHEERRPFTCSHPGCGRSFAMKNSLSRHGVVHDPDRKKINKTRRKRSLASRLSGFKDPKTSPDPGPGPGPKASPIPEVQAPVKSKDLDEPVLVLYPCPSPGSVQPQTQGPGLVLHLLPNSSPEPDPESKPDPDPVQDSVELVSLLKDTSIMCAADTETFEHIANAFTAPLSI